MPPAPDPSPRRLVEVADTKLAVLERSGHRGFVEEQEASLGAARRFLL